MSERIVDNPANHGWVEENGKWVWEGGATTGHIEDGTIDGQITTWDVAKTEWTPDSSLTIDSSGIATFSQQAWVDGSGENRTEVGPGFIEISNDYVSGPFIDFKNEKSKDWDGRIQYHPTNGWDIYTNQYGTASLNIDFNHNATFYGKVDAAGFTINGVPISGGGDLWSQVPEGIYYGGNVICGNAGEDVAGKSVLTFGIARQWAFRQFGTGASAKLDLHAAVGGNKQFVITSLDAPTVASITFESTSGHIRTIGNVYAVNVQASSDERLKDNITTAPVGLIDSLKGREWDWQESGEKGSGVVAQELEKVLPHLVEEDEDGMKSVAYNGLVAYLIEEIKALKAEVEALK